ncbi:MAG: hypothetical protein NW203_10475 [Hyphomonadaceae bacterium]|nr:hypothetical protein [Hyphomonadaceae bacterium]
MSLGATRVALFAAVSIVLSLVSGPARAGEFQLVYRVSQEGAVVGAAIFSGVATEDDYTLRGVLRADVGPFAQSPVELIAVASGDMSGQALSWLRYALAVTENSLRRETDLSNAPSGVVVRKTPEPDTTLTSIAVPRRAQDALDPLTGLFQAARSVRRQNSCDASVLVYDGSLMYRIDVSHGAFPMGGYAGGGYDGPAVRCRFRYALDGAQAADANSAGPHEFRGEVWFATPRGPTLAAPLRAILDTRRGQLFFELHSYRVD